VSAEAEVMRANVQELKELAGGRGRGGKSGQTRQGARAPAARADAGSGKEFARQSDEQYLLDSGGSG
jgi:hypothetical protein